MRFGKEALTSLVFASFAAACSSSGGDASGTGTVTLSLMDRPVDDVSELHVTISEIWLKPRDGEAIELEMTTSPLTVNLLELNDQNASVLVNNAVVPVGTYNWIEMRIEDDEITESFAMTDAGGMTPVDIDVPSGRLRLVSVFEVGENQGVRFLFDWDVRKGLTDPVGQSNTYLLRPAFRILDVDELSAISGTVDLGVVCPGLPSGDQPVVYIFPADDDDVSNDIDDIDDVDPEPVTTANVSLDGSQAYRAVVEEGSYTVALVCDGGSDGDGDDSATIEFLQPDVMLPVTVDPNSPADNVNFTTLTLF